ncbi:hypothetical protein [Amycolatopsis sp. YIM 10]|uniref:hypothetical protein n=1 Tax=Amycolatopsis sp. YIM 10 TaxID=2653857 RepID=UPI00128FE555|nr:hypothetical protein [Amycolatopsis sp. YIM 10]QFU92601.1 hypothetical protein YIM_37220 [Amycolatopsis sp. YIM 10]
MPSEPTRLAGLRPVTVGLAEKCLARPGGQSWGAPLVVALGARGTGKTALLRELADRCADLPHAQVDFEKEDWSNIEPRELLGHLAFDLSRHWRQFGRIAFPRLWLCMLVVGSPVEIGDRRLALRKLREVLAQNQPLEQNRDAVVDVVRLAGGIGGQSTPGWPEATDLLLRGLSWYDRRRLLGKIKSLPASSGKREDFLIEIARWAQGDEDDRASADATFCDAFLADLRRAYSGVNRARRTLNAAVLLDNTHTPGGQAFLRVLAEARRRAGPETDPLAVFATSRGWNPDWNTGWHPPTASGVDEPERRRPSAERTGGLSWPRPRTPSEVDEDWAVPVERAHGQWWPWYLIELGTLSADDTVDLAVAYDIHPTSRLPGFVHRLTDGHPGATTDVLDTIATTYDRSNPTTLRSVFHAEFPRLREYLLQDFPAAGREDLITASAAQDVEILFHREILSMHLPAGEGVLFKTLSDTLWLRAEPGELPRYVLHPLLRRVLLGELAERDDEHELNWDRVHTLCRDFYDRGGRGVSARYHDLALGNVAEAVAHLRKPFDGELDLKQAQAWLAELDQITAAPNRLDKTAEPYDQVREHAGQWADELDSTLAWLLVSLWIAGDPLGDPGGTLDSTIESSFHHLAQGRGRGSMLLHERAERYR